MINKIAYLRKQTLLEIYTLCSFGLRFHAATANDGSAVLLRAVLSCGLLFSTVSRLFHYLPRAYRFLSALVNLRQSHASYGSGKLFVTVRSLLRFMGRPLP